MGKHGLRVLFGVFFTVSVHAAPVPPDCFDQKRRLLQVNNRQVIEWRENTPNQFQSRALVQGVITQIYPEKTGPAHFALNLDSHPAGDIEIIYNQDFGDLHKKHLISPIAPSLYKLQSR
jgi:hypothetical protein